MSRTPRNLEDFTSETVLPATPPILSNGQPSKPSAVEESYDEDELEDELKDELGEKLDDEFDDELDDGYIEQEIQEDVPEFHRIQRSRLPRSTNMTKCVTNTS